MKRILVVDDMAENRCLLAAALRAHGCEVISAHDGVEALACARRQPPDLVISDTLTPYFDGCTLSAWCVEDRGKMSDSPFYFVDVITSSPSFVDSYSF